MSSAASASAIVTLGGLRRAVLTDLRRALPDGGRIGIPELDTRILIGEAMGLDPHALAGRDDVPVDADVVERALGMAARRVAGEPVARILGRWEFWGLELALSPATLVPRPDTETIVEVALAFLKDNRPMADFSILDLGTGSGAILLALLSEFPRARGVGSDRSEAAVLTARGNARRLGLADRASFVVGDWMTPFTGRFDAIVANPPYIPAAEIAGLDVEVRSHDPRAALDGGDDGLDAVRTILAGVGAMLTPRGAAFVEIGAGQRDAVATLVDGAGLNARFVRDLGGIDRVALIEPRTR